jgi:hypothetical protein
MTDIHPLVRLPWARNEAREKGRKGIADAALSASGFVCADPNASAAIEDVDELRAAWRFCRGRVPETALPSGGVWDAHHDVARQPFQMIRSLGRDGLLRFWAGTIRLPG